MNEMVTISRAEYDRLRQAAEDLSDLQAYDRAMEAGDGSVPAEYVNRILNGEHPVRVYRDWRGLTAAALAEASGVNRVQITQLETRKRGGTVETMKKLADALGVAVDDLI
ncbi:DNA-binding transcriptional regulator, XRE-family HTH domain [Pseudooceanicola antarcticus]|uniref:DNA-binding transcriptional regulator, XRE-family HTH domain n=1 Tax=Pseudooceanicola antarcticus TaxID=1247613 RepID=A0A285IZB1_9RHOB|nr:helix-turn-helix transcriptional regulator [Pseudooceanicola antarcticus]PJE25644.1 XRE family transcriptional regulator [Pseudooceanicola antarcticus]SNY53400.1 DNA-binding transcriptional regulator, XRE-family HTH domain [Pseudooceanicola antarcticus]